MKIRKKWLTYQTTPHLKGMSYKIFNEGNNGRIIFRDDEDIRRFKSKLKYYLSPFLVLTAWTLMPEHFHISFIVRKKFKWFGKRFINLDNVIMRYEKISKRKRESIIISEMMRRLFMSYAKYYNKKYGESGSLFRKNYKRILLETIDDEIRAIVYIHKNSQKHGIVSNFRNFLLSSYQIYKDQAKWLISSEGLYYKLFGDIQTMELMHDNLDDNNNQDIQIEY